MRLSPKAWLFLLPAALAALLLPRARVLAAAPPARVSYLEGVAHKEVKGEKSKLSKGAPLGEGDAVLTAGGARLELKFADESLLRLGPSARLELTAAHFGEKREERKMTAKLWFGAALIVFISAELTDELDGVLARMLRQFTRLGAILDPVADKLLGLTALSLLTYKHRLPLWLIAAALFRDICITAAVYLLTRSGRTFPARPTRFGKYATFFLGATVLVALAHAAWPRWDALPAVFALAVIATQCLAVSWGQYLYTWIKLMRSPPTTVGA